MKKTLLTTMALCGLLFAATSCLENVEPAGIEDLRKAKAELVRAEAAYKNAEIQLINAEAAYQQALTEGVNLENALKEKELEQKELELKILADQHEHEKKLQEMELARQELELAEKELELARLEYENEIANGLADAELEQRLAQLEYEKAQIEYQIAELEQDIADLEIRNIQREIDILKLQNEKETLIETHKATLLALEKSLKEAEAELALTLRDIEAAAKGLSPEELNTINEYIANIESIRFAIQNAEADILSKQQAYLSAKFDFDSVGKALEYTLDIEIAQKDLDERKADLALAEAIDLSAEISEFENKVIEIDNEITQIDKKLYDIGIELSKEDPELQVIDDEIAEYNRLITEKNDKISELQTEAANLNAKFFDDFVTIELTMSNEIAHLAAVSGLRELENATDGTIQVLKPFEYDYNTGLFTVPGGKYSWRTTNNTNKNGIPYGFNGLEDVLDNLRGYVANNIQQIQYEEYLDEYTTLYNETKTRFDDNSLKLEKAVADYIKYYDLYTSDASIKILDDAIQDINTYNAILSPTDEDKAKIVTEIRAVIPVLKNRIALDNFHVDQDVQTKIITSTELSLNTALFGTPVTLTMNQVRNEIIGTKNQTVRAYKELIPDNPYYADYIASALDAEDIDKSAMQRWNEASLVNYSVDYADVNYKLTKDFMNYGTDWFYFCMPDDPGNIYYHVKPYQTILTSIANAFGYPANFYATIPLRGFLEPIYYQEMVNTYDITINYQNELAALITTLEKEIEKLNNIEANIQPEKLAIYQKILSLNEEITALNDDINDAYDRRNEVIVRYDAKETEGIRLQNRRYDLINLRDIIVSYINNTLEENTNYEVYDYEQFEQQYKAWIEDLKENIRYAEEDLRNAERDLEKLIAGLYDEQQLIEAAELELKQAEENYKRLLEEFTIWSDLLKAFLEDINS